MNNNTNTNTLSMSHSFSCDVTVQIPKELYEQYKRGDIDLDYFDNEVRGLVNHDTTTYEINYFEYVSEMVENFINDMEENES